MYMYFEKFHLRFIDSLHFFLEPLKNLSSTYNIDTLKGFVPHFFNRPGNQDYVGQIPNEDMYDVRKYNINGLTTRRSQYFPTVLSYRGGLRR